MKRFAVDRKQNGKTVQTFYLEARSGKEAEQIVQKAVETGIGNKRYIVIPKPVVLNFILEQ